MTRIAVLACTRSDLGHDALPGDVQLLEMACTGRASAPLLLALLALGADGVLVLGRHQGTCRLRGAEDSAHALAERADRLATLIGLHAGRVRFEVSDPGPDGPRRSVETFRSVVAALGPSPLAARRPDDAFGREGLDTSLSLCGWMAAQPGLHPEGAAWLDRHHLPLPVPGRPVLVAGNLPYLDLLADRLLRPVSLPEVLTAALDTLTALGVADAGVWPGVPAGVALTLVRQVPAVYTLSADDQAALVAAGVPAVHLCDLMRERRARLSAPPASVGVACDGAGRQADLVRLLGYQPVDVGPDDLPDRFALTPAERARGEARLAAAEHAGAQAILAPGTLGLARMAMLTRQGTWRSSRVRPVTPSQLAWLARRGIPLTPRALAAEAAHV